jgi:hypothetical protein
MCFSFMNWAVHNPGGWYIVIRHQEENKSPQAPTFLVNVKKTEVVELLCRLQNIIEYVLISHFNFYVSFAFLGHRLV